MAHSSKASDSRDGGLFSDIDSFNPQVNSIPLSDVDTHSTGESSITSLVREASGQVSSLVRAEVELAKTELTSTGKKIAIAAGAFAIAGTILAFSSFFFFFWVAESLSNFMPRWLGFLIVFLFMLLLVVVCALIGIKCLKGAQKPEATINSLSQLPEIIPSRADTKSAKIARSRRDGYASPYSPTSDSQAGMYT